MHEMSESPGGYPARSSMRWEIAALVLVLVNVFFAFLEGGENAEDLLELLSFGFAPVIIVLVVLGSARLFGKAKSRRSAAVVAFWTLLVTLVTTCAGFVAPPQA